MHARNLARRVEHLERKKRDFTSNLFVVSRIIASIDSCSGEVSIPSRFYLVELSLLYQRVKPCEHIAKDFDEVSWCVIFSYLCKLTNIGEKYDRIKVLGN